MRQLLIFLLLFMTAFIIDFTPLDIEKMRQEEIVVTVEGAVEHPGEIVLPLYASAKEALEAAQPRENADLSGINPQTILKDKDILLVPEVCEETILKVSINSSTVEELCTLPGIGASTAEKIVMYREEHGLFQELEDLMNVKGIGEKKFASIKDLIKL